MKKETVIIFSMLFLALLVYGCGSNSKITGEAVNDLNQTTAEGTPCASKADCPSIPEPVGNPFCLNGNNYQRYKYYRCSYREPHVCEPYERDLRVGYC